MSAYTITLNEEHLNIINAALLNGPYGAVAPVIAHINSEIKKQLEGAPDSAVWTAARDAASRGLA
jgi:hypothetical protein